MSRRKAAQAVQYRPRQAFDLPAARNAEEAGQAVAQMATSPETAAVRVIRAAEQKSGVGEQLDIPALAAALRDSAALVQGGSLAQAEAMLINQATALQSLFARLAERGMSCDAIPGFEVNMRMALRAQAQCRATLETLAAIKNPPIVYARQANVTTGPQQVNNGVAAELPARAGESEPEPIRLLEGINGQRLDTRATDAAGAADSQLAPVGTVHGTEYCGG